MLVEELFQAERVGIDDLEAHSDGSPYWESCVDFVVKIWKWRTEGLSQRQSAWLDKILEDVIEARIEKRYRQ